MTPLREMSSGLVKAALLAVVMVFALVQVAGAKPSEKPFEVVPGSFQVVPSTLQAGSHEDLTTSFDFAHNGAGETFNDARTIVTELPAGLAGSSIATPTCTTGQLLSGEILSGCPADTQVGTISFTVGKSYSRVAVPLNNIQVTSPGIAAEFGFKAPIVTQLLYVRVRPGDLGLTITTPDITMLAEVHNVKVTVWGVPADPVHDPERNEACITGQTGVEECHGGNESAGIAPKPFLAMPTACSGQPLGTTLKADSWEDPETWVEASSQIAPVTECERVPFEPSITVQPTTALAESSSGLDVTLGVPQTWENPLTIASSDLKDTTVTLPQGYTINPSAGNGLLGCTPQQYAAETAASAPGAGCPPESKLGTAEIETPLLSEKIDGNVYLAQPYDNPFQEPGHPNGSLLALYVVAKEPERGVIVNVSGKVELNQLTGQLTGIFLDTPQQPFDRFTLKFRQGAASPLVSPPLCGTYAAEAVLVPWSAPTEQRSLSSVFQIERGVGGGSCPGGGTPPFSPGVTAGTQNNAAGSYSPFYLRIERHDGEQEITGFSTQMVPGLTGNLSGIPFCGEREIQRAREQSGAEAEVAAACPAASQIGTTIAEAGVGNVLAQTPGRLYLAGPFEGAPFSIVDITSAKVGPFDLGTVVVHLPLFIDSHTAIVSIPAGRPDQIPHIIDGVVIHLRAIRVHIDREHFMLNPTSCEPMDVSATVIGGGADPANPAGYHPATVSNHFQTANCASLKFEPKFHAVTSAKTSREDGASLSVRLSYPAGALGRDANIRQVKVDLPKQLPSRLPTLQKACTKAQFDTNPAGCPAASAVGHARAITPILPVPLEGPAYFVSNGGEAWPNLIVVLQGYGVTIDLVGDTFISKTGVTSSTFKTVPDQPVTSFELTLPEGPYSALTATANLCPTKTKLVRKKATIRVRVHGRTQKRRVTRGVRHTAGGREPISLNMPTEIVGQNGSVLRQNTPIEVTQCSRSRAKAKASKQRARHPRRRRRRG